jgi:hypothetical protein
MQDKYYTLRELEKITGLSRGYINQALTDGALRAELMHLPGRRRTEATTPKWIVYEKDLKSFMRSETIAPYRRIHTSTDPVSKQELTEAGVRRRRLEDMREAKRLGLQLDDYLQLVLE